MKKVVLIISILVLTVTMALAGQRFKVTGTVTGDDGNVIVGASVLEKGTENGAVTDYHGNYALEVASEKAVLVFSFIGYEMKEVKISGRKRVDVCLVSALVELEEVVTCVAHGTEKMVMHREAALSPIRHAKRAHKYDYNLKPNVDDYAAYTTDNESYASIRENAFKDVMQAPLSTFSIDVDKASYSNVRRFINMGQVPPTDAVRVEEMINYFNYDYPQPKGKHPFTVNTEYSDCPWNENHKLLLVGLQGKSIDKEELPASNLVFLVDVSGSMSSQNKLPLLKSAFRMLVNELRPEDRVAMVVYAGAAGCVLESTPGNKKEVILSSLDKLQAGGSTAGGAGIKLAYKIATQNFIPEGNNRIILATDGDFNVGQSSDEHMEQLVEKEREKGIFITVLGFGMGNYKDSKMEVIADKGNGNYAYIDNVSEANKVFVSEFGGTLFTIAKDVKFQIEFNPERVKGYRLVGYENRLLNDEDFNDDTKDAGEMGAGHTVTALYEIIPAGSEESVTGIDPLKYQENNKVERVQPDLSGELMTVKLRYKKPDGNKSTLYTIPVEGKAKAMARTSDNFRFAAAVAHYGMLLRNSKFVKEGSMKDVLTMARGARGEDLNGYRGEFIRLVNTSNQLVAIK